MNQTPPTVIDALRTEFTMSGILRTLYETQPVSGAVRGVTFGVRATLEPVYRPPASLWERIRQVFIGPKLTSRVGEIEIAVVGTNLTVEYWDALRDAIEQIRPCGILVTWVEYHG